MTILDRAALGCRLRKCDSMAPRAPMGPHSASEPVAPRIGNVEALLALCVQARMKP